MKKPYCTQNNGDCSTCSLVNYNLDCQNKPAWGGKREGAGRPSSGRKRRSINLTDEEFDQVMVLVNKLRSTDTSSE